MARENARALAARLDGGTGMKTEHVTTDDEYGHHWHVERGPQLGNGTVEVCCHCGAKRRMIVKEQPPAGCGRFAPSVAVVVGYRGEADGQEWIAGNMVRLTGIDRWHEPCAAGDGA